MAAPTEQSPPSQTLEDNSLRAKPARPTALVEAHRAAGARLVEFSGFVMPLQYSGIVDEHRTVRTHVGLFDVSHMGQALFSGEAAAQTVDRLTTNNVAALTVGEVLYSPLCYPDGGIVDDCLVYRRGEAEFLVVINAANIEKDLAWFAEHTASRCQLRHASDELSLLALQGPKAAAVWCALAGEHAASMRPFTIADVEAAGIRCAASRTGYTGEDGFEILCENAAAPRLWAALMDAGQAHGIKPIGLGARDTLRLEARLMLYGQDIDSTTTPLEAGLRWTVKFKAADFIGRAALLRQKRDGVARKLVSLVMRARGIARTGYAIRRAGNNGSAIEPCIGHVTSGTWSPTLNQAIALAYVPTEDAQLGNTLIVDIRGKPAEAEIVKGPFYKK